MLQRADGTRYKTGTGAYGTYEWSETEGLWAAYIYEGGVQNERKRTTLMGPTPNAAGPTYHACVDHNKKLQGLSGEERGPATRKRETITAVCPECFEAHNGECM
jgi:hypothetical protein